MFGNLKCFLRGMFYLWRISIFLDHSCYRTSTNVKCINNIMREIWQNIVFIVCVWWVRRKLFFRWLFKLVDKLWSGRNFVISRLEHNHHFFFLLFFLHFWTFTKHMHMIKNVTIWTFSQHVGPFHETHAYDQKCYYLNF